jgi:hypothetical protein
MVLALHVDHPAIEIDQPPAKIVFKGAARQHAAFGDVDAIEAFDG